jgi:hypothetical protein
MKNEDASDQEKLEEPQAAAVPAVDPEFEALYDAALSAWRKLCPVKFSTELDNDQAHHAYGVLTLVAHQLTKERPWLSFEGLEEVIFHNDLEAGIAEATEPGLRVMQPTRELAGQGMGMLVKTRTGCKLVMHGSVAVALRSADEEQFRYAANIVRHELCHVHDDRVRRALAARDEVRFEPALGAIYARSPMEQRFFSMANSMWAEYFANKHSHGPAAGDGYDFDLLRAVVQSVKEDVRQAILTYRTSDCQLDALLEVAEQKMRFLAQCFGYAAGRLAGLEVSLETRDPELHSLLVETRLDDSFTEAYEALEALDAAYPDWASFWDVSNLQEVCVHMMQALGLHYRPEGDHLYVDVPYTVDTLPLPKGLAELAVQWQSLSTLGVPLSLQDTAGSSSLQHFCASPQAICQGRSSSTLLNASEITRRL